MQEFEGKTAFVTGGASGIGLGMATAFVAAGMNVVIAWPNSWLSGRRFRNRSGKNGRPHFRCFRISRSTGTMFARAPNGQRPVK